MEEIAADLASKGLPAAELGALLQGSSDSVRSPGWASSPERSRSDEEATLSVTPRGIFGASPTIGPATAGSNGERPGGFRVPAETLVGAGTLQVVDFERSLESCRTTLGLAELGISAGAGDHLSAKRSTSPIRTASASAVAAAGGDDS